MRLLGVTAIIVIVVVAILIGTKSNAAAYETVTQLAKGTAKAGDRVKVGGAVVAGSWNKQSNPMVFTIREESDTSGNGPKLKVVYSGAAPNTFGDGVVAIVTGTLDSKGVVQANEMITKCPSKYESATGAIPVAELSAGTSLVGKAGIQSSGYVSSLSSDPAKRFTLAENPGGTGKGVTVKYSGALSDTVKDGAQVVITGTLESETVFDATSVALSQGK
jgi:cytochrome c-type biogenesis protein CcmE